MLFHRVSVCYSGTLVSITTRRRRLNAGLTRTSAIFWVKKTIGITLAVNGYLVITNCSVFGVTIVFVASFRCSAEPNCHLKRSMGRCDCVYFAQITVLYSICRYLFLSGTLASFPTLILPRSVALTHILVIIKEWKTIMTTRIKLHQ